MSLLVLLIGLFLLREADWQPVAEAEARAQDAVALQGNRLARRTRHDPIRPSPVTLVAIDAASLMGHPWPWSPLDFSLFLQASTPFRPELVAVDEILDWQRSTLSPGERQKLPQYEKILRDALLRCPKVLLAERLGWPEDPDAAPPLQEAPLLRHVQGNLREIPEWTVIAEQAREEFRLSAAVGFTNLPVDRAALHSVPLVLRYQGQVVPAFPLQAMILWQRLSPDDVAVHLGHEIVLGGKTRIPIDARGRLRLNFRAEYLRVGFDELLLAAEQAAAKQKPEIPAEAFAGSVALLARTDSGAEQYRLGLGETASRGQLMAAAIATMQSGAYLTPAPYWAQGALVAAAVLAGFWIPRWRKGRVALACCLLALLYAGGALAAFYYRSLLLPLVLPAGLLLFIALYRAATPNYVWKLRRPVIL